MDRYLIPDARRPHTLSHQSHSRWQNCWKKVKREREWGRWNPSWNCTLRSENYYFRMVLPICCFFDSDGQIHSSIRTSLLWSGLLRPLINLERVYPYFLKGPPTHRQSDFIFITLWENIKLMPVVSDQSMCERDRKICIKRQVCGLLYACVHDLWVS